MERRKAFWQTSGGLGPDRELERRASWIGSARKHSPDWRHFTGITGKTFEERKDIFKRARDVYKERSNIVHGRRSIETVNINILKDGFFLARKSMQCILLDNKLLELYSDPITSDKTKDSDKAIKAIKNYFRDLDLR